MEKYQYDLTGMRFGKLVAIRPHHSNQHKTYWLCRCDCGNEVVVPRPNLSSGKTTSCGCMRSKSTRMHRGLSPKVELPEKDIQWILKHYKHTLNKDIMEKYGLSEGWLHRFARQNGLHKSRQFRAKKQQEITARAKESHLKNGTYPQKGFVIPNCEAGRFKPGHKESAAVLRKRTKKMAETMGKIRKQEKARIAFGLPQKTNLLVKRQSKRMIMQRHELKLLGYHFDRGGRIAWYDENTNRDNIYERRKLGDRCYIYWEFKPLSEKTA